MAKKKDVLSAIEQANAVVEKYLKRRQQITDSDDNNIELEKQVRHSFDILLDNMRSAKQSFLPGISGTPCHWCRGSGQEP